MFGGRIFGNGGLRGCMVLEEPLVEAGIVGKKDGGTFSYEYYARPESRVAGREAHEYTVGTGILET